MGNKPVVVLNVMVSQSHSDRVMAVIGQQITNSPIPGCCMPCLPKRRELQAALECCESCRTAATAAIRTWISDKPRTYVRLAESIQDLEWASNGYFVLPKDLHIKCCSPTRILSLAIVTALIEAAVRKQSPSSPRIKFTKVPEKSCLRKSLSPRK